MNKTKYIKLSDKRTVYVDIDETIIGWDHHSNPKATPIETANNGYLYVVLHKEHIELVKNLYNIGWNVIVWSQGGSDHAEKVVQQVGLNGFVHMIVPKPECYIDDIPFEQQYIKRIYKPFPT